jgi:2-polyprenyl-6-methoxyphenol hydroxylase-like FAD-dependent oxidoreductase
MASALIVGAGPAGASLAHLLAHRGIEVTLLERQSDFQREFRGEVLVPSGIEALEQMGVSAALAAVPVSRPQFFEVLLDRRSVFKFDLDSEFFDGRPPCALSQPALLEMFVDEAGKSGNFRFERGASVKDLLRRDGRVVGVRARLASGEVELRADLVIGADGRSSIVRRKAPLRATAQAPPMDVVWCKLPRPDDFDGARFYLGHGHLAIAYRSWDDQLQVAWGILKGTYGVLRDRGVERWIEEMADFVSPDWSEHFRAHASDLKHPFLLDTVSDRVDTWSVPGALVIGDAAHTMSPVGAQGINVALRDAIVAANHLVPALAVDRVAATAVDAATAALEAERSHEIASIQRRQAIPPRILLNRAWWGEPLRRILATVARSGLARRAQSGPQRRIPGFVRPFLFGASKVELRV